MNTENTIKTSTFAIMRIKSSNSKFPTEYNPRTNVFHPLAFCNVTKD